MIHNIVVPQPTQRDPDCNPYMRIKPQVIGGIKKLGSCISWDLDLHRVVRYMWLRMLRFDCKRLLKDAMSALKRE